MKFELWPKRPTRPPRCAKCKYDIAGTDGGPCPECGYDTSNPVYFNRWGMIILGASGFAIGGFAWLGVSWAPNSFRGIARGNNLHLTVLPLVMAPYVLVCILSIISARYCRWDMGRSDQINWSTRITHYVWSVSIIVGTYALTKYAAAAWIFFLMTP
jgi:hypothetical protein